MQLLSSASTPTYGMWNDNVVPATLSTGDGKSAELGLKFQTRKTGKITGVRFYKSAQNTGIHTGTLWGRNGQALASVTFTNETPSGWQSAFFARPVEIATNTTYIVSYHAPSGYYSSNDSYFESDRINKGLVAMRSSADNPNGLIGYSNSPVFPGRGGQGVNYWVDVIFLPTAE